MSAEGKTKFAVIARWLDSLADRKQTFSSLAREQEELAAIADQFTGVVNEARKLSVDSNNTAGLRTAAIGLLSRDESQQQRDLSILDELLSTEQPAGVQAAAMKRLTRVSNSAAADTLIAHWSHFLPAQQRRASFLQPCEQVALPATEVEHGAARRNQIEDAVILGALSRRLRPGVAELCRDQRAKGLDVVGQ